VVISTPWALCAQGKNPATLGIGGQTVPEPEVLERRKASCICRKLSPASSIVYLLTVYIIPAPAVQLPFHKFTLLAARQLRLKVTAILCRESSLLALSTQHYLFKNFTKLQFVIKLSCSTSGKRCTQ